MPAMRKDMPEGTFREVNLEEEAKGRRTYNFDPLEVGGPSLVFPDLTDRQRNNISVSVFHYNQTHNKYLAVRKLKDGSTAVTRLR